MLFAYARTRVCVRAVRAYLRVGVRGEEVGGSDGVCVGGWGGGMSPSPDDRIKFDLSVCEKVSRTK